MNQTEIEALRGLIDNWLGKQNAHYWGAAKELEALLISLPAPDDGLREGLEALIKEWRQEAKCLNKNYEMEQLRGDETMVNFFASRCAVYNFHANELKDHLAKTPDAWQPIESAPRDGRQVIFCHKDRPEKYVFVSYDESYKEWEDSHGITRDPRYFTHYREKPAPPMEGKECES